MSDERQENNHEKRENSGRLRKKTRQNLLSINELRQILVLSISLCIVVVFYLLIGRMGNILEMVSKILKAMSSVLIGILIAFLLTPLANFLQEAFNSLFSKKTSKKTAYKISKGLSVFCSIVFFLVIIVVFLWILIPQLRDSVTKLTENFGGYVDNVEMWAQKFLKNYPQLEQVVSTYLNDFQKNVTDLINTKLLPNMDTIIKYVSTGIMGGVRIVLDFIIGVIIASYILGCKETLSAQGKKIIYAFFDKKKGNSVLRGFAYINSVFGGFINGKIIDSIIVGLICSIFCQIVNMPYAVLISVVIGVTNIIPFFGPFIGAIPSAVLLLVESPKMCVVFIIFIIILQQVDGNIIGPLILGDSTGLSSLWVLVAIIVGGNLFGFIGMLLGVPVFACVYTFLTIMLRNGLKKRGLNNSTEFFRKLYCFDDNGKPLSNESMKRETAKERRKRIERFNELQHSAGETFHKVTETVIHHKNKDNDDELFETDDEIYLKNVDSKDDVNGK